ncbi:hypothetical protein ACTFIT_003648 [Dictyostelium discoideum]
MIHYKIKQQKISPIPSSQQTKFTNSSKKENGRKPMGCCWWCRFRCTFNSRKSFMLSLCVVGLITAYDFNNASIQLHFQSKKNFGFRVWKMVGSNEKILIFTKVKIQR